MHPSIWSGSHPECSRCVPPAKGSIYFSQFKIPLLPSMKFVKKLWGDGTIQKNGYDKKIFQGMMNIFYILSKKSRLLYNIYVIYFFKSTIPSTIRLGGVSQSPLYNIYSPAWSRKSSAAVSWVRARFPVCSSSFLLIPSSV